METPGDINCRVSCYTRGLSPPLRTPFSPVCHSILLSSIMYSALMWLSLLEHKLLGLRASSMRVLFPPDIHIIYAYHVSSDFVCIQCGITWRRAYILPGGLAADVLDERCFSKSRMWSVWALCSTCVCPSDIHRSWMKYSFYDHIRCDYNMELRKK